MSTAKTATLKYSHAFKQENFKIDSVAIELVLGYHTQAESNQCCRNIAMCISIPALKNLDNIFNNTSES